MRLCSVWSRRNGAKQRCHSINLQSAEREINRTITQRNFYVFQPLSQIQISYFSILVIQSLDGTMLPNGAKSKSMRYEATSGSTSFKMNWNFIMTDAHGESSYNTAIYTDNFYIIIIHWKNQLYQLIDMNSGCERWCPSVKYRKKYKTISFYPPEIHFIWHIFIFVFYK